MGRSPETKKPAPDPPKGLRGPFFDFRAAQPCFVTIFVFDFFLINFGTFAQVCTSIFGIRPKKNFGANFFENFDILFSKAETARPDAPGKKIDLAPHSMLCLTSKYEEKFYFRSIETIFFPSWGLKRLLEPFFHFSPRFLHFLPFLSPQKAPSVFPYTRCTNKNLSPTTKHPWGHLGGPQGHLGGASRPLEPAIIDAMKP